MRYDYLFLVGFLKVKLTYRNQYCRLGSLTFRAPDNEKYPSMNLAYAAGRAGGTMTGVLSAANEKAVELFIDEKYVNFMLISP